MGSRSKFFLRGAKCLFFFSESKMREWMCREGTSVWSCYLVEGHLYSLDSLYAKEIWKLPFVGNNLWL